MCDAEIVRPAEASNAWSQMVRVWHRRGLRLELTSRADNDAERARDTRTA